MIILNNNNHNENNSRNNKKRTYNKDNVISPLPSQNSKENVFILGDSTIKKLNGFLLIRKLSDNLIRTILSFIAGLMI